MNRKSREKILHKVLIEYYDDDLGPDSDYINFQINFNKLEKIVEMAIELTEKEFITYKNDK